jgi:hypothetical protein
MKGGALLLAVLLICTLPAAANEIDGKAVLGGALGGAAGTALGSAIGGREGAILGGALGAGVGAAMGSAPRREYLGKHSSMADDDYRSGPPYGHAYGHRKMRHRHHD